MNKALFETYIKENKKKHHILGRNKLRHFAVLVSLVEIDNTYHFLFEKRAKNIRQGSEISFPGGGFDGLYDKNLQDTAIRETCEELGLTPEDINIITQVDTFAAHIYIENYLGVLKIKNIDDLKINKDEVDYVFTLPVQYFLDNQPEIYGIKVKSFASDFDENGNKVEYMPVEELDLPPRYQKSWNEQMREVYVYRTPHGTLWGITALIVYDTIYNYLDIKK